MYRQFFLVCTIVLFILLSAFVLWKIREKVSDTKRKRQMIAWQNYAKATEEYREWMRDHLYLGGNHPEAQRLLQVRVGALMLYLETNPKDTVSIRKYRDLVERIKHTVP